MVVNAKGGSGKTTLATNLASYFATQNKAICFVFGLMASGLWAYHDFVNLNLKFDGFLQVFYVGMSIWGLYNWKYSARKSFIVH